MSGRHPTTRSTALRRASGLSNLLPAKIRGGTFGNHTQSTGLVQKLTGVRIKVPRGTPTSSECTGLIVTRFPPMLTPTIPSCRLPLAQSRALMHSHMGTMRSYRIQIDGRPWPLLNWHILSRIPVVALGMDETTLQKTPCICTHTHC